MLLCMKMQNIWMRLFLALNEYPNDEDFDQRDADEGEIPALFPEAVIVGEGQNLLEGVTQAYTPIFQDFTRSVIAVTQNDASCK